MQISPARIFLPLQNQWNKKLLFVGIGNRLKSDDAIGIYICEKLQNNTLIVESGIEKFIGKINKLNPDILILVDCTEFGQEAGFADLVNTKEIQDETFNTHTISLKRVAEFFPMQTYLLGIQPENIDFGEQLSDSVKRAADQIIHYLNQNIAHGRT